MKKDKIYTLAALSVGILATVILLLAAVRYLLPALLPFLVAWAVAFAVRPLAGRISRVTRIPERVLRVLLAIFGTTLLFLAVFFILRESVSALWRALTELGEGDALYDLIAAISGPKLPLLGDMMPEELVSRITDAIHGMLTNALTALGTAVTSFAASIPRAILFVVVTVIAVVYFNLDLERINRSVRGLLPTSVGDRLSELRRSLFSVGLRYLGSYLLIMLITFFIMLTGLLLLRVSGAPLIALIIAILDILPVIGVGTVLVPWSIIELARGNTYMGIALILLLLVNEVVRQLAEPRIVGKNLGIHPLLTLVMLYVSYSLLGIGGLLLIPLVPAILGLLEGRRDLKGEKRVPRDR